MDSMEQLRAAHTEIRETLGSKMEIAESMSDKFGVSANEEYELIAQTLDIAQSHLIKLKMRLNKLAPINRLPVEIFTHIIRFTNTSFDFKNHPYIPLTWVCHSWRLVLIQNPIFWTLIRPTYENRHPFLDELLLRSQSAPLDIMLSNYVLDSMPMLKDILIEESDRIRRLYLYIPEDVDLLSLFGKGFPSLRGFYCDEGLCETVFITPFLDILATSDHLESLQCSVKADTPMDKLAPLINRIQNLSLAAHTPAVMESILGVLHNNVKLQKLRFVPFYTRPASASLPNFSGQATFSELQYLSVEAFMMKYIGLPSSQI